MVRDYDRLIFIGYHDARVPRASEEKGRKRNKKKESKRYVKSITLISIINLPAEYHKRRSRTKHPSRSRVRKRIMTCKERYASICTGKYANDPTGYGNRQNECRGEGTCHKGATRRKGTCPVFRRGSNVTIGKYRGGNGNGVSRFARAYFYVSPGNLYRRLPFYRLSLAFSLSLSSVVPLTRAFTHGCDFQRPFRCLLLLPSHSLFPSLSLALSPPTIPLSSLLAPRTIPSLSLGRALF